jgi:predicted nuclease with TOPRIM domain
MQRENETCALKFWINGKNEFKETYAYIPSGTNSESLLNEVNSILKNPSLVNVKHNTSATVLTRLEFEWAVEEKFPFLKKLFDDLQLEFDKLKIHIESLEHKEYKDRYSISREGESLTFDVEYNKDGFFGRVLILPKKTYPRMLIEDLRNTCLKLKNHGV